MLCPGFQKTSIGIGRSPELTGHRSWRGYTRIICPYPKWTVGANRQCTKYMSMYRDLGSLGNFFFVTLDPVVVYWANPPFDVIAGVIQQAIRDRVLMYLLVPRWTHRAWWSQVCNLPHFRVKPCGPYIFKPRVWRSKLHQPGWKCRVVVLDCRVR